MDDGPSWTIREAGAEFVIVGHSERRALYGDTDARVAAKFMAAQAAGLVQILCVGETEAAHDAGETRAVVRRQLEAVLDAAEGKNHAGLALVIAREPEADRLEHVIDRLVIHILALRQPMAIDLRQVLSSFKVAIELERICDHAKDMAERLEAAMAIGPAKLADTAALGRLGAAMLKDAVSAYRQGDATLASEVRQRDRDLDEAYTNLFRDLLAYIGEDVRRVAAGTQLLFIARDIERIGPSENPALRTRSATRSRSSAHSAKVDRHGRGRLSTPNSRGPGGAGCSQSGPTTSR